MRRWTRVSRVFAAAAGLSVRPQHLPSERLLPDDAGLAGMNPSARAE